MQAAFTSDEKRQIAIRLVSSGRWKAAEWPALSAVVRSRLLGLDENGRVVEAPEAKILLASLAEERLPAVRRRR